MKKTIIAIYNKAASGKSETIRNVVDIFQTLYPAAIIEILKTGPDILATIEVGRSKIGIECQGDPNSRLIYEKTVDDLAKRGCNIIVCASRTSGATVDQIEAVAASRGFRVIWRSPYYSRADHRVLNRITAEEIVELIKSIIVGRL